MKKISILGSTGTIGKNALEVARQFPERLRVSVLAADRNWQELLKQIIEFKPKIAVINNVQSYNALKRQIGKKAIATNIICGQEGLIEASVMREIDMVLVALAGTAGILPTYHAARAGKDIALANKESLVSAGDLIKKETARTKARIIPVDSEHSAIFQLLRSVDKKDVRKIILPASGGPFLDLPVADFKRITVNDALNHPVWRMGKKITIDSATLANKGLEVIEAHYLFDVGFDKIDVVIHPQCIIHGLIEMEDGAVFSHMGFPDMKLPIAHAFFYPDRISINKPLGLQAMHCINVYKVDRRRFPFLDLAYKVGRTGKTSPSVFNASDETAVMSFLNGEICFNDIYETVDRVVKKHVPKPVKSIDDVLCAETWARKRTEEVLDTLKRNRRR